MLAPLKTRTDLPRRRGGNHVRLVPADRHRPRADELHACGRRADPRNARPRSSAAPCRRSPTKKMILVRQTSRTRRRLQVQAVYYVIAVEQPAMKSAAATADQPDRRPHPPTPRCGTVAHTSARPARAWAPRTMTGASRSRFPSVGRGVQGDPREARRPREAQGAHRARLRGDSRPRRRRRIQGRRTSARSGTAS